MRHVTEFFLKIISISLIPFYVIGYAIYGFMVWYWNFNHRSCLKGEWEPTIKDGAKCEK